MEREFEKVYKIDSSHVDYQHRLKVSALVNMLIQIASDHADILKFGFFNLDPSGLSWVLSRFTIEFTSHAKWYETIRMKTWPKGLNRLFYQRDAIAYLPDGNEFSRLSSDWLIIDQKTRRPKLFDKENPILKENYDQHALNEPVPVLKFCNHCTHTKTFQLFYSDIDLNGHLTATRYIDFVFDMFDLDELTQPPKKINVNYIHEALFGELVIMKHFKNDKLHQFELTNNQGDKTLFRAELYF